MGKSTIEGKIVEELSFFTERFKELCVTPFDPKMTIQKASANVIENVIWGERRDYNDPDLIEYMNIQNQNLHIISSANVLAAFPFLR